MKKSKGIVLVFTIIFFFFGCQSNESGIVPSELRGIWKTSEPKYIDCYFELTEGEITFANENFLDEMKVNYISDIEKIIPGKRILYTINYVGDDLEYELTLYYDPSGGSIRFKNQQQIKWKKIKRDEY
jgi:hypothetical protein